jgi:hypothetical protein
MTADAVPTDWASAYKQWDDSVPHAFPGHGRRFAFREGWEASRLHYAPWTSAPTPEHPDDLTAEDYIAAARAMDAAGVPAAAGEDTVQAVALVLRRERAGAAPGRRESISDSPRPEGHR